MQATALARLAAIECNCEQIEQNDGEEQGLVMLANEFGVIDA